MGEKTGLILGINGQGGSYLADLLLEKNYKVVGVMRRAIGERLANIRHILNGIELIDGDLLDQPSLNAAVERFHPDEIFALAAHSFVGDSWTQPEVVCQSTGLGVLRVLEAARHYAPESKLYFSASSEMFGKVFETPQTELTPFHPRSPYGAAKAFGYYLVQNYRESYGLHYSSAINFNFESSRRGPEFLTRKVTQFVARLHLGKINEGEKLKLGNLDAQRDWGHAQDAMRAAWLMLQQDKPDDYVIATGKTRTVRNFVEAAFAYINRNWEDWVTIDSSLYRPAEVDLLQGDSGKARRKLGWKPYITFEDLVREMCEEDIKRLFRGHLY